VNIPLNSIKAFALQASTQTRRAVSDGRAIAMQVAKVGGRQMTIRAGIGAAAGGAIGVGASYATDDGHQVRDGLAGAAIGAIGGASWGMGGRSKEIWRSQRIASGPLGPRWSKKGAAAAAAAATARAAGFTETNAIHGPMAGLPEREFMRERFGDPDHVKRALSERASAYAAGTDAMSGAGNIVTNSTPLDRTSSYGYNALPNRYKSKAVLTGRNSKYD
jgi:hypothetical protein